MVKKLQIKIPSGKLHQDMAKTKPFHKEFDQFAKIRSSDRWQKLRASILYENPLCVICGGIASEVHHIIEAHKDASMFFMRENLASVCIDCHKKVHEAYKRGIAPNVLFKSKSGEKLCQE